jgi:hypothetical protein
MLMHRENQITSEEFQRFEQDLLPKRSKPTATEPIAADGVRSHLASRSRKELKDNTIIDNKLVEPRGIEPLTSALRTRRSPS